MTVPLLTPKGALYPSKNYAKCESFAISAFRSRRPAGLGSVTPPESSDVSVGLLRGDRFETGDVFEQGQHNVGELSTIKA